MKIVSVINLRDQIYDDVNHIDDADDSCFPMGPIERTKMGCRVEEQLRSMLHKIHCGAAMSVIRSLAIFRRRPNPHQHQRDWRMEAANNKHA